jgi:hypothetical protein
MRKSKKNNARPSKKKQRPTGTLATKSKVMSLSQGDEDYEEVLFRQPAKKARIRKNSLTANFEDDSLK